MFLVFLIFDLNRLFCKGYKAFASWPILGFFKMLSFFEYKVFSYWSFGHSSSNVLVQSFFASFWHFQFLTETDHFHNKKIWFINRVDNVN